MHKPTIHDIINSGKTLGEMINEAYNIGIKQGKKLAAQEMANDMKWTEFNHGCVNMSTPPHDMNIRLNRKL